MNFAMATLEELALETALLSNQALDLLPPLLCRNLEGVMTGCEGTWELDSVIRDKPSWVGGARLTEKEKTSLNIDSRLECDTSLTISKPCPR